MERYSLRSRGIPSLEAGQDRTDRQTTDQSEF